MIFVETEEDLLEALGMDRDKVWECVDLDDWDYAFIADGKIKNNYWLENILEGGSSDGKWIYIPEIDKTVGMRYHS
ncbi:MAG: hypothetical protein KJ578_15710 [Bacteroidetes bacterium]|nr:hypothetical protein [Bacteroidota bacterium]